MASQWDAKKQRPSTKGANATNEYLLNVKKILDSIENGVTQYIAECEKTQQEIIQSEVAEIVMEKGTGRTAATKHIPTDITEYLEYLINEMSRGAFKFGASDYSPATVKAWKVFRNVYNNFEQSYEKKTGRVLTWDAIDKSVYDSFIIFCQEWGYMTKCINKYIIDFRALIRYAAEYHKLHNNTACLNYFSKIREVEGCAQTKIYLNDAEIQALYDMPLEPGSLKDQVRDIFLIGCYTGQRISDYGHFTAANFTTTPRGTAVVKLIQEKTGNSVIVPILNDNLIAIAEKYGYQFPEISDVIINRYIKDICKELSANVPSLAEMVKTPLTLRENRLEEKHREKAGQELYTRNEFGDVIKPRYDLVCTHTARRSMITNMYKTHRFTTLQMMSISGHKTEAHFFGYISESAVELADEIKAIQEKAGKASNEGLF